MTNKKFFSTLAGDTFTGAKISVPADATITTSAGSVIFNSAVDKALYVVAKDSGGNVIKSCFSHMAITATFVMRPFAAAGAQGVVVGLVQNDADNAWHHGGRQGASGGTAAQTLAFIQSQGSQLGADPLGGKTVTGSITVICKMELLGDLLRYTVTYPANDTRVQTLTEVFAATSFELPRMFAKMGLEFINGDMTLVGLEVEAQYYAAKYALIGDSLTQGRIATDFAHGYGALLRADYPNDILICGAPGSQTSDWINNANIQPVIDMAPKFGLIELTVNDFVNGRTLAAMEADLTTLVGKLQAAGITPVIILCPPIGNPNVVTFNTWVTTQGWQYIDIYSTLLGAGTSLAAAYDSGDHIHWNNAGHAATKNRIALAFASLVPATDFTISLNAKTSTSVTLNLANRTGGYDMVDVQYSTRSDFSFTLSPIASVASAATAMLQYLNQGNTYFIRARQRRTSDGALSAWSNTIRVYLAISVAQDPTPLSIMVRPAIIVVPEAVTWKALGEDVSHPADNLGTDAPSEQAWWATPNLMFDTSGCPINTIALLGTNVPIGAGVTIQGYNSLADRDAQNGNWQFQQVFAQFHASPGLPGRPYYHGLLQLSSTRTEPYWLVIITNATGLPPASLFSAMFGVVGMARTAKNIAADKVEAPIDYGNLSRTRDGIPDRSYGARGRKVDFEIALMTEAQWETQFADLRHKIGLVEPVLVVPNTRTGAFLHDRILYGPMVQQRNTQPYTPRFTQGFTIDSLI